MKIFRKILFFATLVAIPVTILSSCDIFQDGDINDYVGTYKCTTSYESEMSYYWGSDKELSTTEPFNFGSIITIHSDKKVEFHPRNSQETYWGKVRVFKEYCYLIDIPGLEDNYKFELVATNTSKLKGLSYNYRSQSYGVDYQYTKRGIVLTAFIDPSDYSNYVGEYEIKRSERQVHVRSYVDANYNSYQGGRGSNYADLEGGKLVVNSDYSGSLINENNVVRPLSISFTNNKLTITETIQENSVFPCAIETGFLSADKEISLSFSTNVDVPTNETYYTRYSYSFSFSKDIPEKFKYLK